MDQQKKDCKQTTIVDESSVARFVKTDYIDQLDDGSKRVQSRAFGGSEDKRRQKISVDSDMFIEFQRAVLDKILLQLNLNPLEYVFVTLDVFMIRNEIKPEQFSFRKPIDVVHTPLPNRCSHSDITWEMKHRNPLSENKFKKLRRKLAKMVNQFIE